MSIPSPSKKKKNRKISVLHREKHQGRHQASPHVRRMWEEDLWGGWDEMRWGGGGEERRGENPRVCDVICAPALTRSTDGKEDSRIEGLYFAYYAEGFVAVSPPLRNFKTALSTTSGR